MTTRIQLKITSVKINPNLDNQLILTLTRLEGNGTVNHAWLQNEADNCDVRRIVGEGGGNSPDLGVIRRKNENNELEILNQTDLREVWVMLENKEEAEEFLRLYLMADTLIKHFNLEPTVLLTGHRYDSQKPFSHTDKTTFLNITKEANDWVLRLNKKEDKVKPFIVTNWQLSDGSEPVLIRELESEIEEIIELSELISKLVDQDNYDAFDNDKVSGKEYDLYDCSREISFLKSLKDAVSPSPKHTIYNLQFSDRDQSAVTTIVKDDVENWFNYLTKIKAFYDAGLRKKSEVAISYFNGFTFLNFDSSGINLQGKITDKKYKGFPIIDKKQKAVPNADFSLPFDVDEPNPQYKKENIDWFRRVFSDINITTAKKLYGFQPGNIDRNKKYLGENVNLVTKLLIDIIKLSDINDIIKVVFLENKFEEVEFPCKVTPITRNNVNFDTLNNKQDLLDFYLGKEWSSGNSKKGVWKHGTNNDNGLFNKNDFKTAASGSVQKPGGRIFNCYTELSTIFSVIDKDYDNVVDKNVLQTDKGKLTDLKRKFSSSGADDDTVIAKNWTAEINQKFAEIEWQEFFVNNNISDSSQKTIWKDQTGFTPQEAQTAFANGWKDLTINTATDGTGVISNFDKTNKQWDYASHGQPAKTVDPLTEKKSDLDTANKNATDDLQQNLGKATNAEIETAKQGKSNTAERLLETFKKLNQTAGLSLSHSSTSQSSTDNSLSSITKNELTELLKIIGWIEKAQSATNNAKYDENALLELRKINNKTGNLTPFETKIKDFKENDTDSKNWLRKSLEVAENTLKFVKDIAKAEIDKIEQDVTYNASGIKDWTNINNIDKVANLFTLAKNAHSQPDNDYSGSAPTWFSQLESAKTKNDDVWKATDKYQVTDNKGYATRAYEKLKVISEAVKKGETDLKNADTPEKVQQVWDLLAETHPLKNNQSAEQQKLTLGRFKAHALLAKNGTSQDTELANLLVKSLETDYTLDNSGLTNIESDIAKLKKYQGASDTEEEGKSRAKLTEATIGTNGKKLIDYWIAKMEAKREIIKSHVNPNEEEDDKSQEPSKGGWEIWQICAAATVFIGILAIIVYIIKKNSNEEND